MAVGIERKQASRDRRRIRQLVRQVSSACCAVIVALVVASVPRAGSAQSAEKPAAIVVFRLEGEAGTSALRDDLTAAIREHLRKDDQYELVNDDPVVLSDVVVVLGCEDESTTCLEKAADHFGAQYLIFGKLEEVEGRTRVSVRLFDPTKGRYVRSFGRVMSKMEAPYTEFRDEIDQILAPESEQTTTRLRVSSDVKGAKVTLNGEHFGRTPVTKRGIAPGTYRVEVMAEDGRTWETQIEVEPGANVRVRAPLTEPSSDGDSGVVAAEERGSIGDAAPRDESGRATWAPWLVIGVGGLALAGSGVEALIMQEATTDLREWRENHRSSPNGCRGKECDIIDRGENAELAHRVLLGVGGASVVGGFLWLWLQNVGGGEEASAQRLRFSVQPKGVTFGWQW